FCGMRLPGKGVPVSGSMRVTGKPVCAFNAWEKFPERSADEGVRAVTVLPLRLRDNWKLMVKVVFCPLSKCGILRGPPKVPVERKCAKAGLGVSWPVREKGRASKAELSRMSARFPL